MNYQISSNIEMMDYCDVPINISVQLFEMQDSANRKTLSEMAYQEWTRQFDNNARIKNL